ncbi:hypothetical protein BKA63DRAFT_407569 [Paraphoma chrysanthemicola]|nr:hypothetical protein BKA63DRAFT_407569 [Paraphoma chrysanthemicola]
MNPCKQPWTHLAQSKSHEVVNVRITKSTRVQDYELHVPILRHYSGYFRTKRPDVILEVDNPAAFDAYTIWLYQGTLTRAGASTNMSRLFLCQIYVFGLRSDTPALQNAIIDAFITHLASDDAVPYDIVAYLETHALGSKLDELVLDIVHGWMGEKKYVVEYLEDMMVCGKWHVHPEADERDGEGFWFDPPVRKAGGLQ